MRKVCIVMMIIYFVFIFSGCKNDSSQNKDNKVFNFDIKIATEMKKDGWLYYFMYQFTNKADDEPYLCYGAYNLKYKHIDGYDIPIQDEKTGKIIDYTTSSLPYLTLNPKIKPELEKVNAFFMRQAKITPKEVNDLDQLDLKQLDKVHIIKLYNQMLSSDCLPDGKYYFLSVADIVQETPLNDYQWQVGFFIAHGVIQQIHIELIIAGTQYLSDLVEKGEASNEQKTVYQEVQKIEDKIILAQSFIALKYKDTIGKYSFERLLKILDSIETGGYRT